MEILSCLQFLVDQHGRSLVIVEREFNVWSLLYHQVIRSCHFSYLPPRVSILKFDRSFRTIFPFVPLFFSQKLAKEQFPWISCQLPNIEIVCPGIKKINAIARMRLFRDKLNRKREKGGTVFHVAWQLRRMEFRIKFVFTG